MLESILLDDPIHDPECDSIEVTLNFSDGTQRWCICATPSYFQRYITQGVQPKDKEHEGFQWTVLQFFGSSLTTKSGKGFMAFNIPHLVMFSELSEDTIWTAMKHMDDQGELEASSVAYGPARPENDFEDE
ncbi:hypothetical protein [Deinococcus roseus]|uniref:hypothetical protein n=1 Tax=Deinococcus roseus TaxID=392414 RepID=UPI00166DA14E|nr:hypothetical protein [Deinococcus roseus]